MFINGSRGKGEHSQVLESYYNHSSDVSVNILWCVNSEGFWYWCLTLGIAEFLDFVHCLIFYRVQCIIRDWICFHSQVKGLEAPVSWVQWLKLAFCKGPNRVGVSLTLSTEDTNRFNFPNVVFFRIPKHVQSKKVSNSSSMCIISVFKFYVWYVTGGRR
jgi:hypothetical protein